MSSSEKIDLDGLRKLTQGQTVVIEAIIRNGVGYSPAFNKMLGTMSEQAVEKTHKRLKGAGWLHQVPLPERGCCYTLTRPAVLKLGLSKKAKRTMGQGAVIANLGMLCFCAERNVARLTADEVRSTYPELDRPGLQIRNFFTDESVNPPRLTWMLVDRAFSPSNLVRKAASIVKKAHRLACLHELINAGQYAIVLLVPSERKKWLVERVLAKRYFAQVSVSVAVVPELQSLLLS